MTDMFKSKQQKYDYSLDFVSALIFSRWASVLLWSCMNDGAVIDFLNIGIGCAITKRVFFNIADMAILLGVFMLLFGKKRKQYEAKNNS